MKQLTCEMCGSTDLMKQDGVFVCQSCGMKYSVEEAKKMMIEGTVEVQGNVQIKNAAQLKNLLNLAHSSFESKNYAQAENFCNQVIAMDAVNYDAWKLKGEAINYQITAKNQRILEVYNCIMTSYKILDEDGKEKHREEILDSLRTCLEGEIDFWLEQFEAQRPTDAMLEKVKNTFIDCASKALTAFTELGYDEDEAEKYRNFIKSYFLIKANLTCVKTWKSTVYYNYNRGGWTDEYRPDFDILKTYIHEGNNLIYLLEFCIEHSSEKVDAYLIAHTYENIIFFEKELLGATSYKRMVSTTTNGYGAVINRNEYWQEDQKPTAVAIENRKNNIALFKEKIEYEIEIDNKDRTIGEIIKLAKRSLQGHFYFTALQRFEKIVKIKPHSPVGYLGKALCMAAESEDYVYDQVFEEILLASQYPVSTEEKEMVDYLVNYIFDYKHNVHRSKNTLLYIAIVGLRQPKVAKYLITLGADVNFFSKHSLLYYICAYSLPVDKETEWRDVAQLLIEKVKNVDAKETNGFNPLYNIKTDSVIEKMLLAKYPNLEKGCIREYIPSTHTTSGCYVATAVYGSYDCPEVWTLRRYRDYTLAETWYGRAFIKTYYAISPTLVKWFGHTEWFKKMWQSKLDRMVAKLQANGVENTPYEDKNW